MICCIHNPDIPKTPPAHRNKQQTYVGSSLADFHVALQL